jgi:hypothetical protein
MKQHTESQVFEMPFGNVLAAYRPLLLAKAHKTCL